MTVPKRALVLIAVYRSDWEDERFNAGVVPVIAGCIDETVWAHENDDETNARWQAFKEAFDPGGTDYDWREVWITLDPAGLRAPFEMASVAAQIEPATPDA